MLAQQAEELAEPVVALEVAAPWQLRGLVHLDVGIEELEDRLQVDRLERRVEAADELDVRIGGEPHGRPRFCGNVGSVSHAGPEELVLQQFGRPVPEPLDVPAAVAW